MGEKLDFLIPPNVSDWPLWARRAFVLTLPISGSIWVLWLVLWFLVFGVGGAAFVILIILAQAVAVVVYPVYRLWQMVRDLWYREPAGLAALSSSTDGRGSE